MGQLVKRSTNIHINAIDAMDKLLKYSEVFAESSIIPAHYKGNKGDVFVAVQTAYRMNLDPMMVMQGTYVIKGKLGMTSAFAISLANASGLIKSGIRYKIEGTGTDLRVTAYANLKPNGEEISYTIGMKEAQAEGWTSNPKYRSLPELMLRYRAATLLIRTHIPQVLNGMHMTEELEDVHVANNTTSASVIKEVKPLASKLDAFLGEAEEASEMLIIQESKISQLQELIATHNISQQEVSKWCQRGNVNTIEELAEDKLQACIDFVLKNSHSEVNDNQAI